MERITRQILGHDRYQLGKCQADTDPESPRHVMELGVFFLIARNRPRLKSHAADWAVSRLTPNNLRMHGETYSVRTAGGAFVTGSRAIPHLGQFPGVARSE